MKSVKRTIAVILLATFYKISEISYKKKRKKNNKTASEDKKPK